MIASARKWIPQQLLPLQSVMVLGTVLILLLSLAAGLPLTRGALFSVTTLHPVTATLAGFMLAGVVEAAGGFAAAAHLLRKAEHFKWLGLPGAIFLLMNLPTLLAMPCGRVWAAALMPLIIFMSRSAGKALNNRTIAPAVVVAFILNASASCGPSPLGGIGGIGEGHLRLKSGSMTMPQMFSLYIGVPVSGLSVTLFGVLAASPGLGQSALLLGTSIVCAMLCSRLLGYSIWHRGGLLAGIFNGIGIIVL